MNPFVSDFFDSALHCFFWLRVQAGALDCKTVLGSPVACGGKPAGYPRGA